jgi:hypothetical protein
MNNPHQIAHFLHEYRIEIVRSSGRHPLEELKFVQNIPCKDRIELGTICYDAETGEIQPPTFENEARQERIPGFYSAVVLPLEALLRQTGNSTQEFRPIYDAVKRVQKENWDEWHLKLFKDIFSDDKNI